MSSGWIKIHRRVLGWHLYGDIHCRLVFFHLLLLADRTGKVSLPQRKLAEGTGITRKELRGALAKMADTGEIDVIRGETPMEPDTYIIRKWVEYQGREGDTCESSKGPRKGPRKGPEESLAMEGLGEDEGPQKGPQKGPFIGTRIVQEVQDSKESCPVLSARVREGQDDRTGQDISAGDGKPLAGPGGPAEAARAYPTAPEEVVCMARGLGYSMCLNDAAEWLRMNYAYGWRGMDGEPIRTWKRLLRGYLRRNDFRTMAQVEAEERLRAEEAARRRALLEERRRRELEARGPMVSGEAATAILMGDAKG